MIDILSIQLTILLTIAVGYGVAKGGLLSGKTRADLTDIVINIILPCSIFDAFQHGITIELMRSSLAILLSACGLQILVFLLNKVLYFWIPPKKSVILKYATITNNAVFMGFPILGAIYGEIGILYGSIFIIPMRIMMWTAGLSLFTSLDRKKNTIALVTHPCFLTVFIGFAYAFAPFTLPHFLTDAIRWIGECVRILPMFIVGSILSGVKPRDVIDKHCFYFSFLRLICIPAIMFGALSLLRLDSVVIGVTVLEAAMPAAVMTAVLSEKYGQDVDFASKTVFVSMILSIITLPIIAVALTWIHIA